jgi:hypothetical protein
LRQFLKLYIPLPDVNTFSFALVHSMRKVAGMGPKKRDSKKRKQTAEEEEASGARHQEEAPGAKQHDKAPGTSHQEKAPVTSHREKAPGTSHREKAPGAKQHDKAPGTSHQEKAPGAKQHMDTPGTRHQEKAPGTSQGSTRPQADSPIQFEEEEGGLPDLEQSEETIPRGRRKKGSEEERHFLFTTRVEDELIDWWRSHEYLYNNTLPDFLDKAKKERAYEAKAREIGCTSKYYIGCLYHV